MNAVECAYDNSRKTMQVSSSRSPVLSETIPIEGAKIEPGVDEAGGVEERFTILASRSYNDRSLRCEATNQFGTGYACIALHIQCTHYQNDV